MKHSEAATLFETARNKDAGKPIGNNTRLMKRGNDFAIRLHETDVVTIHENDTYTLKTDGWYTVTTKDRINRYSPAHVAQMNWLWYCNGVRFYEGMTLDKHGHVVLSDMSFDLQREILYPDVSSKYGAPMGRANEGEAPAKGIKLHTAHIWLEEGYDEGGAYWGTPNNLMARFTRDGEFIEYYRNEAIA